jgi:hypothetical protein
MPPHRIRRAREWQGVPRIPDRSAGDALCNTLGYRGYAPLRWRFGCQPIVHFGALARAENARWISGLRCGQIKRDPVDDSGRPGRRPERDTRELLAPGWIATDGPTQYWESLTPAQRAERGVPSKLLSTKEIADIVVRLATDRSLNGRVVVWWSEDSPRLIEWGDRGYRDLAGFPAPC